MSRPALAGAALAFAVAAFPLALVVTVAGTLATMEAGVDPALSVVPWLALTYLFLAVAERCLPWRKRWLRSQDDLGTDIALFFTNAAVNGLATPAVLALSAGAGAWLASEAGIGLWPASWPIVAQLGLALVVAEAVEYGLHRAMHEVPWLWRLHATHHSAPRLYWLNALRFHPIDLLLLGTLKLVPLALLGAGAPVFALVSLFSGVHGSFQHANVPVRLGPLNWIFSMSELHRWHHSPRPEEANHNYGGNLIVWDVVFGTRFLPANREPPEELGIEDLPGFPMGFLANLASPFRWHRLVAEASARDAAG